jgi:hypothetical protein
MVPNIETSIEIVHAIITLSINKGAMLIYVKISLFRGICSAYVTDDRSIDLLGTEIECILNVSIRVKNKLLLLDLLLLDLLLTENEYITM